jgi:hypothetical protein
MTTTNRVVSTRKGWAASQRAFRRLTGREVHVGIIEPGEHDAESGLSNAQLMAIHEYGDPRNGIPERSILRATLFEQRANVVDIMTEGVRESSTGGGSLTVTPTRLLAASGRLLARRMKQRFGSSALQPNVIDVGKRGALLDTGKLRRAIRYKVYDAGRVVDEGGDE